MRIRAVNYNTNKKGTLDSRDEIFMLKNLQNNILNNMINVTAIILGFASYAFVILAVFRLLRVNYFNPIVKIFATYLEPVSRSLFFFSQLTTPK